MALPKPKRVKMLNVRVSVPFKEALERATMEAGSPTVSDFIKSAIIEKAERVGVKIDRYK